MGKRKEFEVHFEVEYVPLPPEKEEAYWAAIRFFAELIREDIQKEEQDKQKANIVVPIGEKT